MNARKLYFDAIYQNEREISTSEKGNFPGVFDGYLENFKAFYFDDVCKNYYGVVFGASEQQSINLDIHY